MINPLKIICSALGIGGLLLTNSPTYTNNASSYDAIVQSQYGTTTTANLQLKTPGGVSINSVTDNLIYTIVAPDGRGYQQQLQQNPAATNYVFQGWIGTSLANYLFTNTLAYVLANPNPTNFYRFTGYASGFNGP